MTQCSYCLKEIEGGATIGKDFFCSLDCYDKFLEEKK